MSEHPLANSIERVSTALLEFQNTTFTSQARETHIPGELTLSVQAVSAAVLEHPWQDAPQVQAEDHAPIRTAVCETAAAMVRHRPLLLADSPSVSVSRLIGRAYDENLHSDFVSTLLSTASVGEFASVFLDALLDRAGCPRAPTESEMLFSHREIRLDEIDHHLDGVELGARRIDILARSRARVVAIENKVFTSESDNQTHDYAAAVRRRYGRVGISLHFVLLSPTGMKPRCNDFRALSYRGLYQALQDAAQVCKPLASGQAVLQTYLSCLASDFLHPEERALRASSNSLKEMGYEF